MDVRKVDRFLEATLAQMRGRMISNQQVGLFISGAF